MKRVLSILMLLCLGACGGTKRPPVVATTQGAGSDTRGGAGASEPQPLSEGPDIQAVDAGVASSRDMLSDPSGEGGPLQDVHFEYDSAALSDQARGVLERHAGWIKANPGLRIAVEGHCDERGTVEYNLALGDQRARAVRDYLVNLGVEARILTTVSFGKERPLDPASNEASWARNRRAHFAVSR